MHKQQRRHDVRWRGCPTCWLGLRLHGRTGLYTHACAPVCVQYECAPLYCPIFEKRLVGSLSKAAGLCFFGECLKGGRTLQEHVRACVCVCVGLAASQKLPQGLTITHQNAV